MERVRQVVGTEGLKIPLLVMERYGLQPGTGVVLELGADAIRIVPSAVAQEEIENRALRYVLTHLGDAATVKAERETESPRGNGNWRVSVYGASIAKPLGWLVYSPAGEILPDRCTPLEEMGQRVSEGVSSP